MDFVPVSPKSRQNHAIYLHDYLLAVDTKI